MSETVTINLVDAGEEITVYLNEAARGPAGADGQDGADGAQGPAGQTGATGATGATGPAGSDANVTNANVNAAIATNVTATRTTLGGILQIVSTEQTADFSTTATIPFDATIPQSTEGTEYITQAITPISASSVLEIDVQLMVGGNAGGMIISPLFKDSDANAIFTGSSPTSGSTFFPLSYKYRVASGSTTARTYKVRIGSNGITVYVNRTSAAADIFGASVLSRITITEILL